MAGTPRRWLAARVAATGARLHVVGGAMIVIILLWASLAHHLVQIRNGELDQARRDVSNISIALAEQVSRLIEGTDQVMQLMQQDFTKTSDHFDFEGWMVKSTSFRTIASQVLLVDEKGRSVVSKTRGRNNPVVVADRDYFKYLSTHEDDGLFVGRTSAVGRISGAPAFMLSRRLLDAAGTFRGVLVVSLDPAYIARQFKAIDVAANGSVALFGLDGYIRVRTPEAPGMYERNMLETNPALFRKLREKSNGIDEAESMQDGRARIYGYKTLDGLPLVVAVGRSRDAILEPYGQVMLHTVLNGIAQTAILVTLVLLLLRELNRREARESALSDANEALAEAEASFRGVFESSPDVLWIHRILPDGAITVDRLNRAAALWSDTDQTARGKTIESFLPAAICDIARSRIASVIASGDALRFQEKDARGTSEVVILPLPEPSTGRIDRVFVSIRDITHFEEAARAVAVSEARYKMLAETTSDVIARLDLDFNRTYVSPACRRMFGFEPEELLGRRPSDAVHPDDAPALRELTRALLAAEFPEQRVTATYRTRHKLGHWVSVEAGIVVARNEYGVPEALVCSLRDVSERQAQAQELREAKDAAEAAASLAEQASQAKTDFLAAMSHEIRTPLNGIVGYTDLLLDDGLIQGVQRLQLERIRNSGSALQTVVDDILDFSKIEAGRVDLEPLPFRLANLVDGAVSIVSGSLGPKPLQVVTIIGPDTPATLIGDQDRLRQILLNLLNNAVKFTPRGTVTLSVERLAGSPGATLRFAVTDTGIGIPEDRRGRLFERFSQVDGSVRRTYGGTGLGLAICRSLVETMGGIIGIGSAHPQGSTFWFEVTLPIGGNQTTVDEPGMVEAVRCRPARILLAEDNEINQDLARAVIERAGHALDVVGNGAEAILAVRATPYDIVLMDIQMPVMDGMSATRHIRGMDHPARNVPIIAMSANVLPIQIAEFKAAGMDDHVGKPFKQAILRETIVRWVSEPRPTRAAASDAVDVDPDPELVDTIGWPVPTEWSRVYVSSLWAGARGLVWPA